MAFTSYLAHTQFRLVTTTHVLDMHNLIIQKPSHPAHYKHSHC